MPKMLLEKFGEVAMQLKILFSQPALITCLLFTTGTVLEI